VRRINRLGTEKSKKTRPGERGGTEKGTRSEPSIFLGTTASQRKRKKREGKLGGKRFVGSCAVRRLYRVYLGRGKKYWWESRSARDRSGRANDGEEGRENMTKGIRSD